MVVVGGGGWGRGIDSVEEARQGDTGGKHKREGEKAGDGADKRTRRWCTCTCTCSQVGRKGLR